MSFGKLYGFLGNARTTVLLAVAKDSKLDIEFIETNPDYELPTRYLELNPLRRVPTFEAADGWVLYEVIAIAIYFASQNDNTTLLGKTKRDYAEIVRWMSFVNSEIQPSLANWFKPLVGRRSYDRRNVEAARDVTNKAVAVLEKHFRKSGNRYFMGGDDDDDDDRGRGGNITLADLFAASSLSRGFQYVFDKEWQASYPKVTAWFKSILQLPQWQAVALKFDIVEQAVRRDEEPVPPDQAR